MFVDGDCGEGSLMNAPELRLALEEITIALDCALAAGEQLAGHQIIPSMNFDSLFEHLRSAQAAVDRAKAAAESATAKTLPFPSQLSADQAYRVRPRSDEG